ncbi:MerR family DNA-binding transcriptional regulator [Curtobacterium sp. SP.BCo]|uniref:helix-turn-helix domain-containing protein n=1 Tax=Curtobacterium sp. SP.BCo TaxID=3435229 RepID=UPI003F731553
MHSFQIPPRLVLIGDAAAFVGTTPRAIRHYHQIGLLPERERGSDGRRRYGSEEIIRLLWIRRMADAGIALDDIRAAFADVTPVAAAPHEGATSDEAVTPESAGIPDVLARLEATLAAQEAELQRKRVAVHRMRSLGRRRGLLDGLVSDRLANAPEHAIRQDDLDVLLVTERIFGPLGAAIQAGRFVALALHPELRAESDRLDAAEEALDDTVAVDDPLVATLAAERHAFESALMRVVEESGQLEEDEAIAAEWDAMHPSDAGVPDRSSGSASRATIAAQTIRTMPYDFSAARIRCMEIAVQLGASATTEISRARPDDQGRLWRQGQRPRRPRAVPRTHGLDGSVAPSGAG